jgi:3-methyladenine DNA glycosylase AlkD
MHPFLKNIEKEYQLHANAQAKTWSEKYLLFQFQFFGVKAPVWRTILKKQFKNELPPFDEVEELLIQCFEHPMREMQYTGIELLAQYQNLWKQKHIHLIEYLITHKSWWDSVDHCSSVLSAVYFKQFPEQKFKSAIKWNKSGNIWLQRSSILFQLKYKQETNSKLLFDLILNCSHSKEFFIQKAIGWALREYAKTDAGIVKRFVKQNSLSPLSKREALKGIL